MHLLFALTMLLVAGPTSTYTSVHAMACFPLDLSGMRPTWQTSYPDRFRSRSSQESLPTPKPNALLLMPLCPSVHTGTMRPPRLQQDFSAELVPLNAQPMSPVFHP